MRIHYKFTILRKKDNKYAEAVRVITAITDEEPEAENDPHSFIVRLSELEMWRGVAALVEDGISFKVCREFDRTTKFDDVNDYVRYCSAYCDGNSGQMIGLLIPMIMSDPEDPETYNGELADLTARIAGESTGTGVMEFDGKSGNFAALFASTYWDSTSLRGEYIFETDEVKI